MKFKKSQIDPRILTTLGGFALGYAINGIQGAIIGAIIGFAISYFK
ncbi:MAG: hypothetical protein KAI26_02590 [Nanoarchaeota archaeon]|nr:hypothetical protein [Nanoarchaeota archaeon]